MIPNFFLVIVLLSVFTATVLLEGSTYAQPESSQVQRSSELDIFIFVETFVRNSDGQLLTYLASDKFTFLDLEGINALVNSEASENDPVININGERFQIIKRSLTITYDKENVIASTILADSNDGKTKTLARFAHDGYPIMPGEKVTTFWTFIRPL